MKLSRQEKIALGVVGAAAVVGVVFLVAKSAQAAPATPPAAPPSPTPAPAPPTVPPGYTPMGFILSGSQQAGTIGQGRTAFFYPPEGGAITDWDVDGMTTNSRKDTDGSISIDTDQAQKNTSYQLTFEWHTAAGVAYSTAFTLSIV